MSRPEASCAASASPFSNTDPRAPITRIQNEEDPVFVGVHVVPKVTVTNGVADDPSLALVATSEQRDADNAPKRARTDLHTTISTEQTPNTPIYYVYTKNNTDVVINGDNCTIIVNGPGVSISALGAASTVSVAGDVYNIHVKHGSVRIDGNVEGVSASGTITITGRAKLGDWR